MWDLIVSVPDHCLSFCFPYAKTQYYENSFRIDGAKN